MTNHALGIDFGTANTYLSECSTRDTQTMPVLLEDSLGKATANLYRRNKEQIELFLIGQMAINTYGTTPPHVRSKQGFHLKAQYKPDIGKSRECRNSAEDYFKQLLKDHKGVEAQEVIFGIPSEADDEFKGALKVVALSTGFASTASQVKMYPEPLGALIYHLSRKDTPLSPGDLGRGSLVVDFGGGTCDFTAMGEFHVQHSWGDMLLGGRLFDDLFYQVFLSQNPEAKALIESRHDQHYIQFHECKLAKEEFSNLMQRSKNRDCAFARAIRPYGTLVIEGWKEFEKLARCYRPSPNILAQFPEPPEGPIDLLDWFAKSLREGLLALREKSGQGRIEFALLTGGSSRWPFVADVTREILKDFDSQSVPKVLMSSSPYIDVGEGLSMIPASKHFAEKDVDRLNRFLNKDTTGMSELSGSLDSVFEKARVNLESLVNESFQESLTRALSQSRKAFQSKGGRFKGLRGQLESSLVSATVDEELQRTLENWRKALPEMAQNRVCEDLGRELHFPVSLNRPLGLKEAEQPDWDIEDGALSAVDLPFFEGFLGALGLLSMLAVGFVSGRWDIAVAVGFSLGLGCFALSFTSGFRRFWLSMFEEVPWPSFLVKPLGLNRHFDSMAKDIRGRRLGPLREFWRAYLTAERDRMARDLERQLGMEIGARRALAENLGKPVSLVGEN
ncbi:MAG: Hsp70 family protein [Planctomycetota bacterium]|nr:Hsp70 family protein [Planctomycetota bacterium]